MKPPNKANTGQVGFVAIFWHFSGAKFVVLQSRVHTRPPASTVYRKPFHLTPAAGHIQELLASLIDRTDRKDKSIFRLGLDWIKFALKRSLYFEPIFDFNPWNQLLMYGREIIIAIQR